MVSRWAERMVRPGVFDGGFPDADASLADDSLPKTLSPFLTYLFSRIAPETTASIEAFNRTVDQNPSLKAGDYLDDLADLNAHPGCGMIEYPLLGTTIRRVGFVDTAFQFQTVMRALQSLSVKEQQRFHSEMSAYGGSHLLSLSLSRPIAYRFYRYCLA